MSVTVEEIYCMITNITVESTIIIKIFGKIMYSGIFREMPDLYKNALVLYVTLKEDYIIIDIPGIG